MLQFATEGLDLNNKSTFISEIFTEITKLVSVTDIVGVQLIPKRWPHRVEILCANSESKILLQEKGLSIQNKVIDLSGPGLGKVKVAVDDAPINLDNNTIRDALTSYGKVLNVRYDYLYVDGNRVPWWNGTRHVDMCELKSELPPTIKVRHGQKDIKIKLWHIGQTRIECRWCKGHIVKGEHNCPPKPQRRCFNCGSMSHIKAECPVGKQCFNCGENDHIARDCPNSRLDLSNQGDFPNLSSPEKSLEPDQSCQSNVECLLLGSSNCRDLVISGDDNLRIQVTSHITGALKIKDVVTKLDSISKDKLNAFQTVILHAGSTDFPVSSEHDFETKYMECVENLSEISARCSRAEILISSILLRNENLSTKTNRQIKLFNDKIKNLTDQEPNITFVDSWSCFADDDQVQSSLYRKKDGQKIHLNTSGKTRLAEMLQKALRETVYRSKLENEWQIHVPKSAPQ